MENETMSIQKPNKTVIIDLGKSEYGSVSRDEWRNAMKTKNPIVLNFNTKSRGYQR